MIMFENNKGFKNENQLLEDLFKANSCVCFLKEKGLPVSNKAKKKIKAQYLLNIRNSRYTLSYRYKAGFLEYFFQYYKNNDIGKNIIQVDLVLPPKWPLGKVRSLIKDVFNKDKRIKFAHFYIPMDSRIIKQIKKLGAIESGFDLFGKVDDGLRYLKSMYYDKKITTAGMKTSDLENVVDLDYFAHKYSKTTRCGNIPRKELRAFFKSCLKWKKKVILAKEKKQIIGVVVLGIYAFQVACIHAISVKYEKQKQGISKLLYFKALKYLKEKNIKIYRGTSTTTEVLKLAKKMKRKPRCVCLEMTRDTIYTDTV